MTKIFRAFAVLAVLTISAPVAGCAPLLDTFEKLTMSVQNPLGATDVYRMKTGYAATLQTFVEYRQYCWARPYQTIMADPVAKPICQFRRSVVRKFQAARPKVALAIRVAEDFIVQNPTLSVGSSITAGWKALDDLRALIPSK